MDKKGITIERVNIAAFGKLTEKEIELDPGINLVTAPNEGGKSTLAAFIRFALYGFQGRSQSISDNPKKMYMPWSGGAASGSITVDAHKRLRIERSVIGTRETASCTDITTGSGMYAGKSFGEELLGLGCDIYEKTAFLSTAQPPKGKDEELADRLQNLVFSADEQISGAGAEKILTKRKNALKGRAGNGTVYELDYKLQQLDIKLAAELSAREELSRLEAEVAKIEKEIELRRAEQESADAELANMEKYDAFLLLQERARLKSEAEAAWKAAEVGAPSFDEIEGLRGLKDEYSKHKDRRIDGEATYADLKSRQKSTPHETKLKIERARRKLKTCKAASVALWCGAIAASAAGGALYFVLENLILSLGLVGAGALMIIGAIIAITMSSSALKKEGFAHKAHLETMERRVAAEEETNRDLEFRAVEAARRVAELKAVEDSALNNLKSALLRYTPTVEGRDCDAIISELLKNHIEENALKAKAKSADTALEVFDGKHDTEALQKLAEGAVKPEKTREQLELEKKAALIRIDSYRGLLTEKAADIATLKSGNHTPAITEEERSYTKSQLKKAEASYDALCIALEELEAASDAMKASISPKLAARAAGYFEQVTEGEHRTLELDTAFAMTCDSAYGQKSAEHLSNGARDGVYLCLRLALIDLLYGEKKIPLVLDDAFAHIDTPRMERFIRLLVESRHQLIICSCGEREKAVLDGMGVKYRHIEL